MRDELLEWYPEEMTVDGLLQAAPVAHVELGPIMFRAEVIMRPIVPMMLQPIIGGPRKVEGPAHYFDLEVTGRADAGEGQHVIVGHEAVREIDFEWANDPNDEKVNVYLSTLALDAIRELNFAAQHNIRRMLEEAEERVKRLRIVRYKMGRVRLVHGLTNITVSLEVARMVLAGHNREVKRPFRIEQDSPNSAVCYNEANHPMGRIVFEPKDGEEKTLGLRVTQEEA
jgi:hypothetical protein